MTRSRAFIRVSDERQDQQTQETAISRHEESRAYVPTGEPYRMDGSAYHGKQVKLLSKAIDEMLAGEYDVLVCSASSRLWRGRSAARAVVMIDEAEEQGARFDFIGEPMISTGGAPREYIESIRLQAFQVNRRESDLKSERAKNTHALHRSTGAVSAKAPWGTEITCTVCGHVTGEMRCAHKHEKRFTPTDEAMRLVPEIIRRTIAGEGTMTVAAWLTDATGDKWHETLVARIVRRGSFYADLGLVSHSDAQAAVAASASRRRRGGAPSKRTPALLIPRCACGGPMYRTYTWARPGEERQPVYHCPAKCGVKMISAVDLDALVIEIMSEDSQPHLERVWIAGDNTADLAAKLRAQAMKAYAAGDKARFLELDAQADEADAQPGTRGHWSQRMSCGCQPFDLECIKAGHEYVTEGAYFAALDPAARRDYLRTWVVVAELVDGEAGATIVPVSL